MSRVILWMPLQQEPVPFSRRRNHWIQLRTAEEMSLALIFVIPLSLSMSEMSTTDSTSSVTPDYGALEGLPEGFFEWRGSLTLPWGTTATKVKVSQGYLQLNAFCLRQR